MKRTISYMLAAGFTALALSGPTLADDTYPLSVNESGPVYPQHAAVPAVPRGATSSNSPAREIGSVRTEVQTPTSVSESAPWLAGTDRR